MKNGGVLNPEIVCSISHNKIIIKLFSLFNDQGCSKVDTDENCFVLKPHQHFSHLFNEFNNLMSDPNSDS